MSVITHVTNVCDRCGHKENNAGEGHYNLPGWASVRMSINIFHHPWKRDETENNAVYCPTCVTNFGKSDLMILTAKTLESK